MIKGPDKTWAWNPLQTLADRFSWRSNLELKRHREILLLDPRESLQILSFSDMVNKRRLTEQISCCKEPVDLFILINDYKNNLAVLHAAQQLRIVFAFGGIVVVDTMGLGKTFLLLLFFNFGTVHISSRRLHFHRMIVEAVRFGKTLSDFFSFLHYIPLHRFSKKSHLITFLSILWGSEKHVWCFFSTNVTERIFSGVQYFDSIIVGTIGFGKTLPGLVVLEQ